MSVVFKDGVLSDSQKLSIESDDALALIEEITKGVLPDKRFAYYLMGATGICVVPLSGFNSDLFGFRMTLLEPDEEKFREIVQMIADKAKEYLKSGN